MNVTGIFYPCYRTAKHIKIFRSCVSMTASCMIVCDSQCQSLDDQGTEGFKNCRKGTTVAAQTTGVAMASRLQKAGVTTVRVAVKGLGPGRMVSFCYCANGDCDTDVLSIQ